MMKSVHWVGVEVHDSPRYNRTNSIDQFLRKMDLVTQEYRMDVLDTTLKWTPAKWWETHKHDMPGWETS